MEIQKLNCELSVIEWNVVLRALDLMPYNQVVAIIPNIQAQLNGQIQTAEKPAE